jgi:lysine 6-dehydrogenase
MKYGVLGAGRQGVAAAYDLARFGQSEQIWLADVDAASAAAGAQRVNQLLGREAVIPKACDVSDPAAVGNLIREWDVCASAVPYDYNLALTKAAIDSNCCFCDLGGNTGVVEAQLALHAPALAAGISVIPDCGVGPGMISNLAVHAIEQLDVAQDVVIYDGGIPENPRPPFNYALFFNIGGLINEYYGQARYIVEGELVNVSTLDTSEYELVDIPGFGELEGFVTSGALSTMAQTYRGRLRTLKNKTLRYPGHFAFIKPLLDTGLMAIESIAVGNTEVVPRQVLEALLGPLFAPHEGDRDVMVIHVVASGTKGGAKTVVTVDLAARHDEVTGFTAMERTTGFHLGIVAAMMARGETPRGAIPLEVAVPAGTLVEELHARGLGPEVAISTIAAL